MKGENSGTKKWNDGSDEWHKAVAEAQKWSNKYKNPEENTIQATDEVVQWASEHLELVEQGKEIEREVRERANKIKSYMKDFTILDLGNNGRVTWRANSRGNRIFRNLYESKKEG